MIGRASTTRSEAMGDSTKAAVASQAQAYFSVGKYEKALECLQRLASQMVRG